MSSGLRKIKTVLNDDIRRFDLDQTTVERLLQLICDTYQVSNANNISLSYEDDEGDMCQISTQPELDEAFRVADTHSKVLKLHVQLIDTDLPAAKRAKTSSSNPAPIPAHSPTIAPVQTSSSSSSVPIVVDEKKEFEPFVDEVTFPSKAEQIQLLDNFFNDPKIRAALPDAIRAAIASIRSNESAQTVIDSAIAVSDDIYSHPSVRRFVPLIPFVIPRFTLIIEQLRAAPHILSLAENFLPQFLPLILAQLPNYLQKMADSLDDSNSSAMPTDADSVAQLMSMFSSFAPFSAAATNSTNCPSTSSTSSVPVPCDFEIADDVEIDEKKQESGESAVAVHSNVQCDGCGMHPIRGNRYKCSICVNFDLCQTCESKGAHPREHAMIMMKTPQDDLRVKVKQGHRHHGHGHHGHGHGHRGHHHGHGHHGHGHHHFEEQPREQEQEQEQRAEDSRPLPMDAFEAFNHLGFGRGHGFCGRGKRMRGFFGRRDFNNWRRSESCENANANATSTSSSSTTTTDKRPRADFIKHITLADRSEVYTGQTLIKTWQVKNSGQVTWPEGSRLVFLRGDRQISAEEEYPVSSAAPGDIVDLSAVILTPDRPGRYTAYFRLANAEREMYGARFWVDLIVVEDNSHASAINVPDVIPLADPRVQRFSDKLETLINMGFSDREQILTLLERHGGNLQRVLDDLN